MEAYILANNFDTKKDFYRLASLGLKAYYEVVTENSPAHLFDKGLFKDTGFDQIDIESLFL